MSLTFLKIIQTFVRKYWGNKDRETKRREKKCEKE